MADDRDKAERDLRRVERDTDGVFGSTRRLADHFAARDADPGDRVELWGRRVGRALSLVGVVVLALLLIYQLRTR